MPVLERRQTVLKILEQLRGLDALKDLFWTELNYERENKPLRQAELEHTLSLSQGQRYALRELRVLFGLSLDDDIKTQINVLEKAFRGPLTTAVNRELNRIRRNGMTGQHLMRALTALYHQHSMRDWAERRHPAS